MDKLKNFLSRVGFFIKHISQVLLEQHYIICASATLSFREYISILFLFEKEIKAFIYICEQSIK